MRNLFSLPVITALIIFVAIAGGYWWMAHYYPEAYIRGTYEDQYGEWTQTWFFAVGALIYARLAFFRSRYRWFFILLALACFYTFGEEISWGQRVFDIESPEIFKEKNLQKETNLHNFLVGPVSTDTKQYIEYIMCAALVMYGVLYPMLLGLGWSFARWWDSIGLAAPPLWFMPSFAIAGWLELAPFSFNEAEVAELLVGSAMALTGLFYWAILRAGPVPERWLLMPPGGQRTWLGVSHVLLVAAVVGLAFFSTWQALQDPDWKRKIDARMLNGYEKFASRYTRFDRHDVAVDFYTRVHEAEPNRTSILRKLARAHKRNGSDAQFVKYTRKALELGLKRYAARPDSISNNLSLAYSYRQLGKQDRYSDHADRALMLAEKRVADNPDSASAYYWLGKVWNMKGQKVRARDAYKRAHELKPGSSKYRRAYHRLRSAFGD